VEEENGSDHSTSLIFSWHRSKYDVHC